MYDFELTAVEDIDAESWADDDAPLGLDDHDLEDVWAFATDDAYDL